MSEQVEKQIFPEKPRVQMVKTKTDDDDIEEFDTDDEDESQKAKEPSGDYTKYLTYEGDKCIYNEPGTGRRLEWDKTKNEWCPAKENYKFDGKNYLYTDETSKVTYKFLKEKNEWEVVDDEKMKTESTEEKKEESQYGFENDTHTYTDPQDGTVYIFDKEKKAWFPKVDDDFYARYQYNYGFVDPNASSDDASGKLKEPPAPKKMTKEEKKAENKKKSQEPPSWFNVDEAHNTSIYVSGLPVDCTLDEVTELFTKCGLLARDDKNKDKIKIYMDGEGHMKGDARCTYLKVESVDLALQILDGWNIRGHTLHVQRAQFQMKGDYNPKLKPKKKKNQKEKQKKIQEKLLGWTPDKIVGEPQRHERIVIIKNLFTLEDFERDNTLILEYQNDIRSECTKCGEVKKVEIHDRNPDGVAQVTFKEFEGAEACVQLLNGRWFGQRRISAEIWDGKTKYKIKETDAEIEARLKKWDKFLDNEAENSEPATKKLKVDEELVKETSSKQIEEPSSSREPEINSELKTIETIEEPDSSSEPQTNETIEEPDSSSESKSNEATETPDSSSEPKPSEAIDEPDSSSEPMEESTASVLER